MQKAPAKGAKTDWEEERTEKGIERRVGERESGRTKGKRRRETRRGEACGGATRIRHQRLTRREQEIEREQGRKGDSGESVSHSRLSLFPFCRPTHKRHRHKQTEESARQEGEAQTKERALEAAARLAV